MSLPDVPVTITEYAFGATVAVVLIVRIEVTPVLPEDVTDFGLRLQVTPATAELHVSATTLLNPLSDAMLIVDVAELPAATVVGDVPAAEIWKSGVVPDSTINGSAAIRVRFPDTPDTVSV